jgi:DDE_Tnp_1-associated
MRQLRRFPRDGIRRLQRQEAEPPRLLAYLAAAPDPRSALGRRHPLVAILALAAAAVLAAARSFAAIAEWATDAPSRSAPAPARTSWPACATWSSACSAGPGPGNLAAALRHHARDPARPLATLGITPPSSHP